MGKSKKRISKDRKLKVSVKTNIINNETAPIKPLNIHFDLSDSRWLTSIKYKDFTNFTSDKIRGLEAQFYVIYKLIPHLYSNWEITKKTLGVRHVSHNHRILGEQHTLVNEIHQKIYKYKLPEEVKIFQFKHTGICRLIAIYDEAKEVIKPLFIDHHHLIYNDTRYNNDYKACNYCLVCGDS